MRKLVIAIAWLIILFGLYAISRYNYLLLHSVAELFSVIIACGIFMVAWNCRKYLDNQYFLFIGVAYLFVGVLDLLHTFTYDGMPLFPGFDANAPTQFWIAARYLESLSLLFAPLMLWRRIRKEYYFFGFAGVTLLLLLSILYWRVFPDCFIQGAGGLTPFKKTSEYIISFFLLCSGAVLFRLRGRFDRKVLLLLESSIGFTILAELSFTTYASVYGFSNMLGHFFKIVSFYLIYKAIIQTGLTHPYELLFRELNQNEQRYRTLFESMQPFRLLEPIFDDEGKPFDYRYIEVNAAAAQLIGSTQGRMQGKTFRDVFPDADSYWIDAIGRVALNGEPAEFEWHSQVTGLWYHSIAYRLEGGKVASLMLDITEQKQAQEALKRSNEELEQYAYVASHDLQAPLRSMVGFLQLLQGRYGEKIDGEGRHFIERAVSAGYRMQTLIGELLTLSRINTAEVVFEPCNLNRIVRDVLDNLDLNLQEKNAEVSCAELPCLAADPGQIQSLFQNLISNGVKYNRNPQPVIEIGCRENGHAFLFFIKDNGIGIASQHHQNIFRVFERLHTEKDYPGTGLGLALCKKIVERHGGSIWVESRPDEGSTFNFTLPQYK